MGITIQQPPSARTRKFEPSRITESYLHNRDSQGKRGLLLKAETPQPPKPQPHTDEQEDDGPKVPDLPEPLPRNDPDAVPDPLPEDQGPVEPAVLVSIVIGDRIVVHGTEARVG